jgi:hypothetical protein
MPKPKPLWALAGTMPTDHGLEAIRGSVYADPRQRRLGIVEFCFLDSKVHRPEDADDEYTEIMTVKTIYTPATDADRDQLAAMLARARASQPGQGTLDDEEILAGRGQDGDQS